MCTNVQNTTNIYKVFNLTLHPRRCKFQIAYKPVTESHIAKNLMPYLVGLAGKYDLKLIRPLYAIIHSLMDRR